VSKLRENNKQVIGVGVKSSSSDLLVDNCDEFLYYDDLVRQKTKHRKTPAKTKTAGDSGNKSKGRGDRQEAFDLVLETVESLFQERDNLWGSMVKQTLKRKRPNFAESYYGYRSFNALLEDAEREDLLVIEKDQKSGGYLILDFGDAVGD
jgi:hypothetical protein